MATRFYLTVCIAGLILPIITWADSGSQLEVHYAPRENLESVDIREIGRAELSIDMAAYVLSDPQIIEALTDAAERDVVIRLYLDKSQFAEHGPVRGGLVEALLAHPTRAGQGRGRFDALESLRRRWRSVAVRATSPALGSPARTTTFS
jgi:phosphatidylserine/phosphatidylglycerophosphate/cardiolipin synthase-like enzyme